MAYKTLVKCLLYDLYMYNIKITCSNMLKQALHPDYETIIGNYQMHNHAENKSERD